MNGNEYLSIGPDLENRRISPKYPFCLRIFGESPLLTMLNWNWISLGWQNKWQFQVKAFRRPSALNQQESAISENLISEDYRAQKLMSVIY